MGFKMLYHTLKTPVLVGGAVMLSYRVLYDIITHHKESQDIPDIIQHAKCWAILSAVASAVYLGPTKWISPMLFTVCFIFPVYWLAHERLTHRYRPLANDVFYLPSVSQAEKDKIEYNENIEALGHTMSREWGFGRRA